MTNTSTTERVATTGAIVASIVGLGTSVAALIDDLGPAPTFCSSACEVVRQSAWAKPLGIPVSALGVAFFAAMLALAVIDRPWARRVRLPLAIAGGLAGVGLIVLQGFVIEAWCRLCLVADPAAIATAIFVALGARAVRPAFPQVALSGLLLALTIGGIALWTDVPAPGPAIALTGEALPEVIQREQVPGTVTIVEFLDFECPHCRRMAKKLDDAIARAKVPVKIVRKMMPLGMHKNAIPAAVAWCCADAQGKGEEMARALVEAPVAELAFEDCKKTAEKLGCDMQRFMADIPAAKQRIADDVRAAEAAKVEALPTLFIGDVRFTGAGATTEELVAAIVRAKDR